MRARCCAKGVKRGKRTEKMALMGICVSVLTIIAHGTEGLTKKRTPIVGRTSDCVFFNLKKPKPAV
jgi:hypothetical protein